MLALDNRWLVLGVSPLLATLAACAAPDPAPPPGTDVAAQASDPLDAFRGDACTDIAPAPHFRDWPRIRSAVRSDPRDEAWIRSVVAAMSRFLLHSLASPWYSLRSAYHLANSAGIMPSTLVLNRVPLALMQT